MKRLTTTFIAAGGLLLGSAALADHHGDQMHGGEMHGGEMHGHQGMEGRMPMFGMFDENKDGKLSRDELRKGVDKMFAETDTNKDGTISQDEMRARHKAMHDKMRGQMQEQWKAADKDGDGALSRAEVDAAKMPRLSRDFDRLDGNKDGKLTPEEMRDAMMRRPGNAAPAQPK